MIQNKILILATTLTVVISGCTSYLHPDPSPTSYGKQLFENGYKFLCTQTYYFSQTNNVIYSDGNSTVDVIQLKDGSYHSGLVTRINSDSVVYKKESTMGYFPTNLIENINFSSQNPSKSTFEKDFSALKRQQYGMGTPSYAALGNYVLMTYGVNATYANVVWDIRKSGLSQAYTAVTFDIYLKK